jgi:hypothetical protein
MSASREESQYANSGDEQDDPSGKEVVGEQGEQGEERKWMREDEGWNELGSALVQED